MHKYDNPASVLISTDGKYLFSYNLILNKVKNEKGEQHSDLHNILVHNIVNISAAHVLFNVISMK
jgi:hypothetical protein